MAAAVGDALPFQARLSGGFAPSKRGPTRGAGDRPVELSPDTRIAIALIEKRAIESPTPAVLADLGVAYLIQGDIDRAITTLDDAASQLNTAAPWSDLSAAYLAKAERTPARKVELLSHALESAEKSLRIARTNDALFNRALARDGLAPYVGAPAPWADFAAVESDTQWAAAAAAHVANRARPDDPRDQWQARHAELPAKVQAGDTRFLRDTVRLYPEASIEFLERELLTNVEAIGAASRLAAAMFDVTQDPMMRDEVNALRSHGTALAMAHRSYASGQPQGGSTNRNTRTALLESREAFVRLKAPYRLWADTRLAVSEWRQGHFDVAQDMLATVEHAARAAGYKALLARVLWQRGLVFNRQWQLTDGLASLRESARLYEAMGHRESMAGVTSNIADALRMLGEVNESWVSVGRTLDLLPHVRDPLSRYLYLYNASLFASRTSLDDAALLFQDAATREAGKAGSEVQTEALVQRALIHISRGDHARAEADLEQASRQAATATTEGFRAYINAELDIARAQLTRNPDAASNLQRAIRFFSALEPGRVPQLYLRLARIPDASPSETERALQAGIDALEARQATLRDEALQISFFDESWMLFQDMVSLQLAARRPDRAFEFAERSRARALLAAAQRATSSEIRSLAYITSQLPQDVVLVYFSTLRDRLLIWTIASASHRLIERPVDEATLDRLIEQHRQSVHDRRDRPANDRLYDLLIAPVLPSIAPHAIVVLVPDGPLQQLPFATLRNPATRRYLIEDHPILTSPSASFFVDALAAARSRMAAPVTSALLIGNPTAVATRALPGAEAEVAMAAKLYPQAEVLTGSTATKSTFMQRSPDFDVIHFGGHAFANPEYPLLSRLVFADEHGAEQSLFAREISTVQFPRTRVVVLAACSTAVGAVSRGEGIVSVARPFLGAGVPLVVASQWDVDDRATEQLTLAFHREFTRSRDAIRALQVAQLALLRSGDGSLALPESWGAFVAVGTAAY